ncbi:ER membrane complex subunit 2 [Dinochytrium kinnereticum]|nr:ER membrane complex subunit 2 [Dinochytrium kinnereticum]
MAPRKIVEDAEAALVRLASLRAGVDIGKVSGTDGSSAGNTHYYDPNEVFTVGKEILSKHNSSIRSDSERFAILEQVFIASLDTGNLVEARKFLDKIQKKFPTKSSNRSSLLAGMLAEAEGDDATAIQIYQAAMKEDETNALVRKRIVALYWATGKRTEAIAALTKFVDFYAQDFEAWSQLASYYLASCMFQQAAFCLEEMIIYRPGYHLVQVQYADVLKTMGKDELALKYYCSALEIAKDQIRALYGIRLTTSVLIKKASAKPKSGKEVSKEVASPDLEVASLEILEKLHKLAGDRLTALYAEKAKKGSGVDYSSIVKAWLEASA